jgi:hypothetical protein
MVRSFFVLIALLFVMFLGAGCNPDPCDDPEFAAAHWTACGGDTGPDPEGEGLVLARAYVPDMDGGYTEDTAVPIAVKRNLGDLEPFTGHAGTPIPVPAPKSYLIGFGDITHTDLAGLLPVHTDPNGFMMTFRESIDQVEVAEGEEPTVKEGYGDAYWMGVARVTDCFAGETGDDCEVYTEPGQQHGLTDVNSGKLELPLTLGNDSWLEVEGGTVNLAGKLAENGAEVIQSETIWLPESLLFAYGEEPYVARITVEFFNE